METQVKIVMTSLLHDLKYDLYASDAEREERASHRLHLLQYLVENYVSNSRWIANQEIESVLNAYTELVTEEESVWFNKTF